MRVTVRELTADDIDAAARVHADAFARQGHSRQWIAANAGGAPRLRLYVAELEGDVVGYILWTEKSGFRDEAVIELDQLAVLSSRRNQGIGRMLIERSLPRVADELAQRPARIKAVIVTTRTDNHAQRLYRNVLGAEPEAVISELYSADEVIMVARAPFPCLA